MRTVLRAFVLVLSTLATLLLRAQEALPPGEDGSPGADDTLEDRVRAVRERAEFRGSSFGILISDVETGEVVYEHRADALLAPASTAKLVSCAGALAVLGPDRRFTTPVVRTGRVDDGVLTGDLVLIGQGDPNLSQRVTVGRSGSPERLRFVDRDHTYAGYADSEVVPGDPLVVLRALGRRVLASGIREVRGDVVADDGLFKETSDSFVGTFSAVCVNDNVVDITVGPGDRVGDLARVVWSPRVPTIEVRVLARTSPPGTEPDFWVETAPGVASFVVRGAVPLGASAGLRVGRFSDPALVAAHLFADVLSEAGVKISGRARRARFGPSIYERFQVVAEHVSPPFSESVRVALKVSHNLHATMLPVLVGAIETGRGDRLSGFAVLREFYRERGLDVDGVVLHTGSGGGRADCLSARFTVEVLRLMAERRDFPVFYDALPVAGVDGTLASRFGASPLRGRVRAKTGTLVYRGSFNDRWIYLSKALAGYLDLRKPDTRGRMLCFSILIANTVTPSRAAGVEALFSAQEDILEAVAAHVWEPAEASEAAGESAQTDGNDAGSGTTKPDAARGTESP